MNNGGSSRTTMMQTTTTRNARGNSAARDLAGNGRGGSMRTSSLPRLPLAVAAAHYEPLRDVVFRARVWLRAEGATSSVVRAIRADGVVVEARVSLRATTVLRRLAVVGG